MQSNNILSSMTLAGLLIATAATAGGNLDTFKFTDRSTLDGFTDVEVVPIRWDPRCSSVEYTLDTIAPNAGTENEIDIETVRSELQASLDKWNEIDTSYIELNITEVRTINNGLRTFDFINELTFETDPTFQALASSPSVSLQEDAEFVAGDDIDGDGDSDVFDPNEAGRSTCYDADDDGDIEFPAGSYRAGTILDNDVQFSSTVLWNTEPDATQAADIQAVATHEFGHSHGLSHTGINQISDNDGTGSTMFPSIDLTDTNSEIGTRTLHEDDIAWSSFNYPEGTQPSGIGALQPGDKPFARSYIVIGGEVTRDGSGVLGANVFAKRAGRDGPINVDGVSGTALVLQDQATGDVILAPEELGVVNGNYQIPLKRGVYELGLQALDGSPVAASQVNITGNVGLLYGQQNFPEEFLSFRGRETGIEINPGRSRFIPAFISRPFQDLDFVVNEDVVVQSYEDLDFIGTQRVFDQPNVVYATRFSNSDVLELLNSGATLTTMLVNTNILDASLVPEFKRVSLVSGTIAEDGIPEVNMRFAYRQVRNWVGQDNDDSPIFLRGVRGLSKRLIFDLQRNPDKDLFVVVEADDNFELGDSGFPPLVGLDVDGPFGDSFLSLNGEPFEAVDLNFGIQLRFTEDNSRR